MQLPLDSLLGMRGLAGSLAGVSTCAAVCTHVLQHHHASSATNTCCKELCLLLEQRGRATSACAVQPCAPLT